MNTDCLLIIDNDSPLNLALEMLFGPGSGIKAVKSEATNFQSLVNEVCNLKSPVIVVEDSATLTEKTSFVQLLVSNPKFKIIVILRDSNHIHVFRKEEIMIQSASELIEAIQSI